MSHGDDGAGDDGVIGVARNVHDEGLVDLELGNGQGLELRQRGMAGAEIVHHDADAHLFHPVQLDNGFRAPFQDHAFGHFHFQPIDRVTGLRKQVDQFLGTARQQLAGREVDGQHERRQALFPPLQALGAGHLDDPAADLVDQPGFLGHRDELVRWNIAALGMLPAQQGFHYPDLLAVNIVLGLVVDAELVLFQRGAQVAFHRHPCLDVLGQAGFIIMVTIAPEILGLVHGGIRVLHQGHDVVAVFRVDADADAGGDQVLVLLQPERL